MRVLVLCYEYPPLGGGGAKVADGLIRELVQQGHEIDLVTMGYPGLPGREARGPLRIFRISCRRRHLSFCNPFEMAIYLMGAFFLGLQLCRRHHYRINHTHFVFPDGILALCMRVISGLPFIITAHGSDIPGYNPDRFRLLHDILRPCWKRVVSAAANIVFPSKSLQSLAWRVEPDLQSLVIPNGFDIFKFDPNRQKKHRILIVTRMFRRKGVQYFLRAMAELDQRVEINIVGDGPYLPALEKMAAELQVAAVFHGHLDNNSPLLKDLYETSTIFVFTSIAENFPTVLLEAMAAGLAIITTNGTGCAEVVGEHATLVKPGDTAELRQALQRHLQGKSTCEEMGKKARLRLETNFSWPSIARRYLTVYAEAGSRSGAESIAVGETAE